MTFFDLDKVSATSFAASNRRSSISAGPASVVASVINRAASLSPSARITDAFFSCSAVTMIVLVCARVGFNIEEVLFALLNFVEIS